MKMMTNLYCFKEPFSNIVHDENLRKNFITTSVKFIRDHKFDGLDLE